MINFIKPFRKPITSGGQWEPTREYRQDSSKYFQHSTTSLKLVTTQPTSELEGCGVQASPPNHNPHRSETRLPEQFLKMMLIRCSRTAW